jgi:hypothetical protein
MFSRRPVQKLSTHMTAAPGIEQRVARMRSHEPGAAKYDGSVKSRVALTSPTPRQPRGALIAWSAPRRLAVCWYTAAVSAATRSQE